VQSKRRKRIAGNGKEINIISSNQLTSITIPDSVTAIGWYSFGNCTSITSVKFEGEITSDSFETTAFDHSSDTGYIGDLRTKYIAGGIGTYTRPNTSSYTWTKQ